MKDRERGRERERERERERVRKGVEEREKGNQMQSEAIMSNFGQSRSNHTESPETVGERALQNWPPIFCDIQRRVEILDLRLSDGKKKKKK